MTSSLPSQQDLKPSHKPAVDSVAILDCGAQYTKVIDRRVRELKVATQIFPLDVDPKELEGRFDAIIISGGPGNVYDAASPHCQSGIFDLGKPVLGICYGMQLITHHFGGVVEPLPSKEYGVTKIKADKESLLFKGLSAEQQVLMSHGDSLVKLPEGFEIVASSVDENVPAVIQDPVRKVYGVQFHPEVELTENGVMMLENFLYQVVGLSGNFELDDRLEMALTQIREQAAGRPVFVLVSGGVDSSVTAALLVKALGPEQVYAVHIDSGFMRHNESDLVCDALKAIGLKHLRRINAQDQFLNTLIEIDGKPKLKLCETVDPEHKRRIIGDVFYQLIQEAITADQLDLDQTLVAQGTLRPDLIESGNPDVSVSAHTIKTHHNDVPIIQEQRKKGLIIEPNRDWHKDEVRQIGRMLGLPEPLVNRQPFPGPGLAIRMLCAESPYVTAEFDQLQQQLNELIASLGLPLQGNLLPVKSVGVQGDARTYSYLAALSLKKAECRWDLLTWETLQLLAQTIPNRLHAINRVVLVANQFGVPESIQSITPTHLVPETIEKLRQLDRQVTELFQAEGYYDFISQLLTVLVPVDTDNQGRHSISIRGVVTTDFMTARPVALGKELPWSFIEQVTQLLSKDPGVNLVLWDITGKPPATVEYE